MDQSVKRIRPADYELSTVQDNLANSVDQLLAAAAGSTSASQIILSPKLQQVRGAGTPYSIQKPALQINGDPQNTGGTSLIIGTAATASAPQLDANTVLYGSLGIVGPVACSNGFKTTLSCGEYWNTAPAANSFFQFARTVFNVATQSLGSTPFIMKWTHSGSVVGLTVNEAGPNAAQKTIYVYKNGNLVYTWAAGASGGNATFWTQLPKGSVPFTAGDTMTLYGQVASTANTQLMLHLTLEMSA